MPATAPEAISGVGCRFHGQQSHVGGGNIGHMGGVHVGGGNIVPLAAATISGRVVALTSPVLADGAVVPSMAFFYGNSIILARQQLAWPKLARPQPRSLRP